jgi:FkbM family methyltransferase
MLKATMSDIEHCYRLILGRPSDPPGFRVFENLVVGGISTLELARHFVESTEGLAIANRRANEQMRYDTKELPYARMAIIPSWNSINAEISNEGEYEAHVTAVLAKHLRKGVTFVDIGANVGYFSIFAAARGAQVIAIEPHPRNVFLLTKSNMLNGFQIEIFPGILAETAAFYLYNFADGNGQIEEIGDELPSKMQSICRATTLDALLDGRKADVIKMDVESAEGLVLAGADRTLAQRPVLVSEFTPLAIQSISRMKPTDYIRKIQSYGYRFELIERGAPAPVAVSMDALVKAGEASPTGFVDFVAMPN